MKTIIALLSALLYAIQEFIFQFGEYIITFISSFMLVLKTIMIAISGGFVDYIIQRKKNNESFSFKKSFFHCFIAGFTGFLAQKLCNGFNINQDLTSFLIGISGFAGTRMLSFFEKLSKSIFEKLSDLEIDIKMKKHDKSEKENEDN